MKNCMEKGGGVLEGYLSASFPGSSRCHLRLLAGGLAVVWQANVFSSLSRATPRGLKSPRCCSPGRMPHIFSFDCAGLQAISAATCVGLESWYNMKGLPHLHCRRIASRSHGVESGGARAVRRFTDREMPGGARSVPQGLPKIPQHPHIYRRQRILHLQSSKRERSTGCSPFWPF